MALFSAIPGHTLALSCPCELPAVRSVARSLRDFLEHHGIPPAHVDSWELVIAEAGNNAVRYSPSHASSIPIGFTAEINPDWVEIRITDHTDGFELPDTFELPPPDWERGRGLFLMHSLSDSLDYLRGQHGNCLVVRRNLPPPPPLLDPASTSTSASASTPSTAAALPTPATPADELETTLQTMTEELAASYESLSAIFRFTEDLARGGVNPAFVERWLNELKSITGADWFVLRLPDNQNQALHSYQTLPPHLDLPPLTVTSASSPGLPVELCATVDHLDVWFDHQRPLSPSDPLARVGPELSGFAHPMFVSGELTGVLTIGFYGPTSAFTAGHVSIVQTLSDFLAIQVRDAQYEQARLQARLLRRDYEVASDIQRRLLPKEHPTIGPWVTRGFCKSAQRVGGDFYDILPITPHHLLLAVADVMGKGLPAALFANVFRTLLRARRDLAPRPGAFLEWLNRDLAADLDELEMFITAQLAFVDLQTREIRIAGAGHPPLLIAGRNHPTSQIISSGPPLGIVGGLTFQEIRIPMPPSARIMMYTDGMTEVTDQGGEQAGVDPLLRILDDSVAHSLSAESISNRLVQLQTEIAGDRPVADDRTFLLLVEEER